MNPPLQSREAALLWSVLALLAFAVLGPDVAQHAHYHAFADQHTRWGVPCAMDVLSNLPFAVAGLAGAYLLRQARGLSRTERLLGGLACLGLVLTAVGSAWYHLAPDDAGLAIDRTAMSAAFAGLLGLAACRVSDRAATAIAGCVLVAAPLAVFWWSASGDLLPWAVLQGGGMLLLVVFAFTRPTGPALPVRWGVVIAAYAVAKLLEAGDHLVWELSGQWVSGHTLKHVVAAAAVLPLLAAWRRAAAVQNALRPPQAA
jgi:hypothetical protein